MPPSSEDFDRLKLGSSADDPAGSRSSDVDPVLEQIYRISDERDGYYSEWKNSQNQIRQVRTSLMWRVAKASLAIRRLFHRPEPKWLTESLFDAIEATPPDGNKFEKAPDPGAGRSTLRRKPIRMADRDSHLERVTFERNGYYGEWRHTENRLETIHCSDLWLHWEPFRRFKTRLGFALYLLKVIRGLTISIVLAPFRAVILAAKSITKLPGVVYTLCWTAATSLRAVFRDGRTIEAKVQAADNPNQSESFRPRILIVSPYHLHPPNHGSGVRLLNLVRELASSCDVFLLVFSPTGENPEERKALEALCRRVDYHRWLPHLKPNPFGLTPAVAEVFRSDRVTEKIRDIVIANDIDIVQLEHAELGQYRHAVPKGIPVVLSEIDIAFRTHQRRRKLSFHTRFDEAQILHTTTMDVLRLFRYEVQNCKHVQQIHTMSEIDAAYLARFLADGASRIRVIPNGVDTDAFRPTQPAGQRNDVLFVGNFNHLPNVDALDFLLKDVWPLLRLRVPDARLNVVGASPSDRVTALTDCPGVTLIGEVPDPRLYYHRHRVMVAPIRAGSGTRLKILESFAAGIPVVSTSLGAEGIEAENDKHLILADRAMDFADGIERVLTDDALFESLAEAASSLVRQKYDWRFVAQRMHEGFLDLIPEKKRIEMEAVRNAKSEKQQQISLVEQGPLPLVSIVIPTFRGGADLERCLSSIRKQQVDFDYEILCVDSGSDASDIEIMQRFGARVIGIAQKEFNHGLTRDFGATCARGEYLVLMSQDAVPIRNDWLDRLTEPLRVDSTGTLAAVQGGSIDVVDTERRFFWGTSGERFYFTSESHRWIERFGGVGFSTTNCAIRRIVWDQYRFGEASILEDKKWQRQILDAGYEICALPEVKVFHSHDYDLRTLLRRCSSEGFGWRSLGERYSLIDAVSDVFSPSVWRELLFGLQQKSVRTSAEIGFPLLRPFALWWGNRFSRRVLH